MLGRKKGEEKKKRRREKTKEITSSQKAVFSEADENKKSLKVYFCGLVTGNKLEKIRTKGVVVAHESVRERNFTCVPRSDSSSSYVWSFYIHAEDRILVASLDKKIVYCLWSFLRSCHIKEIPQTIAPCHKMYLT